LQQKKLLRSKTDSLSRLADAKAEVASHVDTSSVSRHMNDLTKPNSVSKTMKKVGFALLASPDIVTDVPGVALVATSYVMKKKDPIGLGELASETRKILRDINSLSL
jgi:hypothetical protein